MLDIRLTTDRVRDLDEQWFKGSSDELPITGEIPSSLETVSAFIREGVVSIARKVHLTISKI